MLRHVQSIPPKDAKGLLARVHDQVQADWGGAFAPFVLHDAEARLAAGAWSLFREAHLTGPTPRHIKDLVGATIAHQSGCLFLLDAHCLSLEAAERHEAAAAIRGGNPAAMVDPGMRLMAGWAASTTLPGAPILKDPPFEKGVAIEMTATAVVHHYLSRMVTIFVAGDAVGRGPRWMRRWRERGRVVKSERPPPSGASLGLLPDAPLPKDLAWARRSPILAAALARLAGAAETAAHEVVPADAKLVVRRRIEAWRGGPPPSPGWTEPLIQPLPAPSRALARLSLLAALAPHQVTPNVIHDVRRYYGRDADVLAAASWGSLLAARRIGSWVAEPTPAAVA